MNSDRATTVLGTGLGMAFYGGTVGLRPPQSESDLICLGISLAITLLGYFTNRGK